MLTQGRSQIQAYFDGKLNRFDLPLAPAGSPYRRRIWQALTEIPFGATQS